ncbi:hypothetical protein GC163_18535 [bacterium]|nr:hypothetical protein [bacterium]
MSRTRLFAMVSLTLLAGVSLWFTSSNWAQEKAPEKAKVQADLPLKAFMRQKLAASSEILEGITTENSALVKSGAETLTELSHTEKWRVSNDVIYKQFSEEFQRNAKKLADAAEKGNYDDVTLKWIDVTLSCVECHKFVRGLRLAGE